MPQMAPGRADKPFDPLVGFDLDSCMTLFLVSLRMRVLLTFFGLRGVRDSVRSEFEIFRFSQIGMVVPQTRNAAIALDRVGFVYPFACSW